MPPTAYDLARAEFLENAARIFAAEGWGATTRELARRCHVSLTTINTAFTEHEGESQHETEYVPGKDGLITAVVTWAVGRWHDELGPVVSRSAGEPAPDRVAAAFDRLAEAVAEDPAPFALLVRALDLRMTHPEERDQQHPGKRAAIRHRAKVAKLLEDLMAPPVAARLGQTRREKVADELASLMLCAGYAGVAGRPEDAVTLRDAALLLMADRLEQ